MGKPNNPPPKKSKCTACVNGKVQKYDEKTKMYTGFIYTCPTCNGSGEVSN